MSIIDIVRNDTRQRLAWQKDRSIRIRKSGPLVDTKYPYYTTSNLDNWRDVRELFNSL